MESTDVRTPTKSAPTLRALGLGFTALLSATFCLIVLGALVRAHGAGLACPDWPLCFGQVIPEFDFKVAFEWGHRTLAGLITSIFLATSVLVLRNGEARRAVGRLLPLAVVILALQILLGALTVWKLLAYWSVTSHLLAGNAYAVLLLLMARALMEAAEPAPRAAVPTTRPIRLLSAATLGLLILQVGLGGLVSSLYAGLACPDWPMCANGQFAPTLLGPQGVHVLHRLAAYSLILLLALSAWQTRGVPRLGYWHAVALLIGIAQLIVGIANVLLLIPAEVTGLHSALAAALVLALAMANREAWRGAAADGIAVGSSGQSPKAPAGWPSADAVTASRRSSALPDRGL
ncbi:MAG: hypothetical protein CL910_06035 [Deltaproteobacteria bacterium]|jgi:heme A synthase|nr:hypothetical protein [Deltaproteobacteria bacterium]